MSRALLLAVLLLPAAAAAQSRSWTETKERLALDAAARTALGQLAQRMGMTAAQAPNVTYVSFASGVVDTPTPHRVFLAQSIRVARCLSSAQVDSLGAAGKLGETALGIVGDATAPAPSWFSAAGCSNGQKVYEVSVDDKTLDSGDVTSLKALHVELLRLASWANTTADRLRGVTCGRNLGSDAGTPYCSAIVVVDKTDADHTAEIRAKRPVRLLFPGDPMLVN